MTGQIEKVLREEVEKARIQGQSFNREKAWEAVSAQLPEARREDVRAAASKLGLKGVGGRPKKTRPK